jgi:opacity protein-like surface antigen
MRFQNSWEIRNTIKRRKTMVRARMLVSALLGALLLCASAAKAQEREPGGRNEVSVQGTGFFTKDSQGTGFSQHSTDTGGFLISYRYHFNRWLAADASYGYARNTQQNLTTPSALNVQATVHQATGALVVTVPHSVFRLRPFLLAGAGALVFDPTSYANQSVPGVQSQAKAAFVYGGGVDFPLVTHIALRAEYRGFVYARPDFGLAALNTSVTTHTAQPSAGLVFRF